MLLLNSEQKFNTEKGEQMKFVAMINRYSFKDKKTAQKFAGAIKNNTNVKFKSDALEDLTIDSLEQAILSGKTIIPAVIEGKIVDAGFQKQQLFLVDIDDIDCTLDELKERYKDFPIALIYTTFSHTEEHAKYRLCFVADKVIEDRETAKKVNVSLISLAQCADTCTQDVSRIFYAGHNVVYKNDVAFNVNKLLKEVDISNIDVSEKNTTKTASNESRDVEEVIITVDEIKANLSKIKKDFAGTKIDVTNSFEWFNKNISLEYVLDKSLNEYFRDLMPGHVDAHPSAILEEYDDQVYYRCVSNSVFCKPKSTIDTIYHLTNLTKGQIAVMMAKVLGIKLGSEYQRNVQEQIILTKINYSDIIQEGSILDKEMRYLHGAYNCILDFVLEKVTVKPLSNNPETATFFMSAKMLENRMKKLDMRGAGNAYAKIAQLKDLGLLRALPDSEIDATALARAKAEAEKLKIATGATKANRTEFYELTNLTAEVIENAEKIIMQRKESGCKKRHAGTTRRVMTHGLEHAAEVNVQAKELVSKKDIKNAKKMLKKAEELIAEQGYFTEEQLRRRFDSKRKMRKSQSEQIVLNMIPFVVRSLNLNKKRISKVTRKTFNIPSSLKSNSVIYTK